MTQKTQRPPESRQGNALNNTFLVPALLCATIVAAFAAPHTLAPAKHVSAQEQVSAQEAEHEQWVIHSLSEMHTIKVGMTRGDLKKVFYGEGGFYSSGAQTFIYRGCPYFKVHVGFASAGAQFELGENPKDKIISLSEPFINNVSQPN